LPIEPKNWPKIIEPNSAEIGRNTRRYFTRTLWTGFKMVTMVKVGKVNITVA
jgi:hypothetical protein